ncbi:hypothetical protein HAV22_14045 [Massilia sp. TW-1]|uniref:Uncharacterized protein n=1 Tax=Telluria antibiotica TaxID=2717319 RepID=A0ABX0PBP8_9BURK|nr:hypothetical protein [Telluria antibiotica]NIA54756.1 hypothetical protein [Telluria antibiotica]
MNDKDIKAFRALTSQADIVKVELNAIGQHLAGARRKFFQNPSDELKGEMTELEKKGVAASDRLNDIIKDMGALLKLTAEEIEDIETARETGDSPPRYSRDQLTVDQVAPTGGDVNTLLSQSFDKLLELIPASTLTTYRSLAMESPCIKRENGLLSIVKGVVPESESPQIHRFAQCVNESHFWLTNNPNYDMFAGASLVPQIARLAERLDVLSNVPGAMKRIRSLWRGTSRDVDSTIFELLVAAGCAIKGRSVEFLEPRGGKTPDLRCHDPYPIVIECKRKRVLTEYELSEERVMRSLFEKLDTYARAAGMWGMFLLELSIESKLISIDEIVSCLLQLRFAGKSGSRATWPWGTATYVESAKLVNIGGNTRMYSPFMLNEVFGWNSDLAEWDGLICRVRNFYEPVLDMAEEPVGLLWVNSSEQAIKKRSWGPMSTLNEAIEQVPPGEFGIPFVAYQEGARSAIADIRTLNLADWLKECCHPANVRVPFGRIFRLYPRPLQHGAPDFIESSISFVADYGDNILPSLFPSNVIVH